MENLLSRNHVDFVTTPIKSPPTKNLAVKRSLKVSKTPKAPIKLKKSCTIDCSEDEQDRKDKKDILDFLCSDEETRNQSDSEDLIDFESPPLIDLSEAEEDVSNVSFLNARNIEQSKALTEFLKEFDDNEQENSSENGALEENGELSHSEESSTTTNSTTSTTYIPLHELVKYLNTYMIYR